MLHNHFLLILLAVITPLATTTAGSAIITHTITSPYQPRPLTISVITPDPIDPTKRYPVLYVLPVEPEGGTRYGSGINEAKKEDLANRYDVICVEPAFAATPWYADHPTDPALQQESHFIEAVIPWVEEHYPVRPSREGRFLLGFSKSGNGAILLLLRHPDLFERAVAWDAPVDKTRPDQFRMIDIFGTEENFQQYAIPNLLVERAALLKGEGPRIMFLAKPKGGHAMEGIHRQLVEMAIPHVYEYTEDLEHRWDSGWVKRATERVVGAAKE